MEIKLTKTTKKLLEKNVVIVITMETVASI